MEGSSKKKILVTGAGGFIGKNLCLTLRTEGYEVICFDNSGEISLEDAICSCDFIMHLAGVNRPKDANQFYAVNTDLTSKIIDLCKLHQRFLPILFSSSIQAILNNDYGKSKKMAEELLRNYHRETGANIYIFRLTNAFGKWCKPNYNSVIATFCYNIAHNIDIVINDPERVIEFAYIDDIVAAFINCIEMKSNNEIYTVEPSYKKSLSEIASLIKAFKKSRENLSIANMKDEFCKKLYATYLSYLPLDEFSYPLKMNIDSRGSFTELIKTISQGQISVNISHPGITKGNHWHHTKNEKFIVVAGEGVIRLRSLCNDEIVEYYVSGKEIQVVDIPVGYTHCIENIGTTDLVTIMWANEVFDSNKPDTFYESVV
ncbi:NAD-dependent epimerase/dehydratase family protein [Holdemania massiliensis]|uniref:polysaccharide biosynthesis C-terminal domain-containing protein n=1 Tax=Holdemania massiliensis TaxID=1468449 RepID=UPI001F06DB64|nr:NAD-dependent epimerase/dehydratase family protein [Holdemania massiliensis]MCH1940220.1 NAD-dependent epimerase/dehydratase family protein [Holdemania massiliensis]